MEAINPVFFLDFWRYDNIALNQRYIITFRSGPLSIDDWDPYKEKQS